MHKILYLKTCFDVIKDRLSTDSQRPLFRDPGKARELFEGRLPLYEQVSDFTVTTDEQSVDEVADLIVKIFAKEKS